jgi:uncharacterized protein (DUF2147 family)
MPGQFRYMLQARDGTMARLVAVAFTLLGLAIAGPAHAADISGVWLTDTADAHIRVAKCGANMCGTIIWLKEPKDPRTGKMATDEHNHDPAKRSRPLLGIQVALDFHPSSEDPAKYVGRFYNADDGSTYAGSISQQGADALRVEGCLLMFCQAQIWTRVKH